jgi:septal ring factor EnvC (AmiA/AmiB activator)
MKKLIFIISYIILSFNCGFSQTIQELENRRKKTEQEIVLTNKLLTETQKKKVQNINQLNTLKKQVELRRRLISDYESQIILIEKDIEDKTIIVNELQKDIINLKKEYAKLIQFAWRNRTDMQILIFIFASEDFNQAYRRIRFYQQLLKFRETQAKEILNTQKLVENEIELLTKSRDKLSMLKIEKNVEFSNLSRDESRYSQNVKQLQTKEKQLRREIEERRKSMEAIEKIIAELIAEEAKRKAEKDRVRDDRYIRLSDGFIGNKGKLPWPSNPGVIIGDFGEHFHPVLKEIKIRNSGIDIGTEPNSSVKAIFEGEVSKIVNIPGSNVTVIIRHGDFLSVYSNLVKIKVKVGESVSTSQIIGEAYTEHEGKQGMVNLQIWQENKIQNPRHWILP